MSLPNAGNGSHIGRMSAVNAEHFLGCWSVTTSPSGTTAKSYENRTAVSTMRVDFAVRAAVLFIGLSTVFADMSSLSSLDIFSTVTIAYESGGLPSLFHSMISTIIVLSLLLCDFPGSWDWNVLRQNIDLDFGFLGIEKQMWNFSVSLGNTSVEKIIEYLINLWWRFISLVQYCAIISSFNVQKVWYRQMILVRLSWFAILSPSLCSVSNISTWSSRSSIHRSRSSVLPTKIWGVALLAVWYHFFWWVSVANLFTLGKARLLWHYCTPSL